jgi:ribosome-binding protein aMBF1 (putative translation factor)
MSKESIGRLIAKARQRRGMTQVELAERLGCAASTVADWERGDAYPARYAGKVEELLNITIPARPREAAS